MLVMMWMIAGMLQSEYKVRSLKKKKELVSGKDLRI